MVKSLHSAGIEVILDVVYNHTAEGSQLGPTLSFRGIDNFVYYRTVADNPRYYIDYTGTGNTLNMDFALIWLRPWPVNCTKSTDLAPSSTSFIRIQFSLR